MLNYFSSDFKLGILGGGQLGKMMLYETRKYDIQTLVLDPSKEAPSRISCNYFEQGDLLDYDTVLNFGRKADVVTFEIEGVNIDALKQLASEGIKTYPSANTLEKIQNKAIQKKFYKEHTIPTAEFEVFDTAQDLKTAVKNNQIEIPFVWKSATGGYDGKGVSVIRDKSDLDNINGLGPTLKLNLIRFFGGVDKVMDASIEELETVPGIGKAKARHIHSHIRRT